MPRGTQCHMAPTSKVGRDWCLGARFRGASVAATEARQTDTQKSTGRPTVYRGQGQAHLPSFSAASQANDSALGRAPICAPH